MQVADIEKILFDFAPRDLAEEWDNVGLQAGFSTEEVNGILIALDLTKTVIEQAIKSNCNLIITHHPVLYNSTKNLTDNGKYIDYLIAYALRNNINIISMHTNVDKCAGGINDTLATLFGGENLRFCKESLFGTLFSCPTCELGEMARKVSKIINDDLVSTIGDIKEKCDKFLIIGGAGCEEKTIEFCAKNDIVFITGEIKHHLAVIAQDINCKIINIGHFTSEKIFVTIVYNLLKKYEKENSVALPKLIIGEMKNPFHGITEIK